MSIAPPTTAHGGVKIYNLSSVGKALPAWVTNKKKLAALSTSAKRRKRAERVDERLEVIQDLFFPTMSGRVKVSRDGETLLATGGYPPQARAYELRELSLKFSRHFECDVVQFQILSPDWKKLVFLLADRSIEFHSQFGKHHTTRIPHHGRALAYQRETCELLLGGAGEEVYRLSLERGSFLNPLKTGASGVNALAVHPGHGMLAVGTSDGVVQCWDPRQRSYLGASSPFDAPELARQTMPPAAAALIGAGSLLAGTVADPTLGAAREISALRFDPRGLQLAVGTSTGQVAVYDIRRGKPLHVKDHYNAMPILDIKYHEHSGKVVSSDRKAIKVWERDTGNAYTTILPNADINDVAIYPESGMVFAALETERLGAYFVPSMGPAPKWCHFLDGVTEEMEEQVSTVQSMYDDYKFVTMEELEKLQLSSLYGTNALKPYMHGYFIDARLHRKAVALSQPFAYEQWRKERLEQKINAKTAGRIAPIVRPKPKVNAEFADELKAAPKAAAAKAKSGRAQAAAEAEVAAGELLDDSRFAGLFSDPDFEIDRTSDAFQSAHPHAKEQQAARKAAAAESEEEEEEEGEEEDYEEGEEGEEEEDDDDDDEDAETRPAPTGGHRAANKRGRDGGSRAAAASASSTQAAAGSTVRMIGLRHDVLKGTDGAGLPVSALPPSASFGDRLAALGGAAGGGGAGSGRLAIGNREMSFNASSLARDDETSSGGKGRGRGGKGSMGRGGKGGKNALSERIDDGGEPREERRGMGRGMLSPGKGGGKGKGGKGKGGKGRGGKGGRGKGRGR